MFYIVVLHVQVVFGPSYFHIRSKTLFSCVNLELVFDKKMGLKTTRIYYDKMLYHMI